MKITRTNGDYRVKTIVIDRARQSRVVAFTRSVGSLSPGRKPDCELWVVCSLHPRQTPEALHAIWCLSNSQLNRRNLKRTVPSISCELSDKNSEEWSNVCLKPQMVGVSGWMEGGGVGGGA